MAQNNLSEPPQTRSLRLYVENSWEFVWKARRAGAPYRRLIMNIEQTVDIRKNMLDQLRANEPQYDWHFDYNEGNSTNKWNLEHLNWSQNSDENARLMWADWHKAQIDFRQSISVEGFKAMILVNGTAIIAALAVISGEIDKPNPVAIFAAKIGLIGAVASLVLTAIGHAVAVSEIDRMLPTVRSALSPDSRPGRLYALGRYLKRHGRWWRRGIDLVYAAIAVFVTTAIFCTFILLWA